MSVNEWEVKNFTFKQLILETNNDFFLSQLWKLHRIILL